MSNWYATSVILRMEEAITCGWDRRCQLPAPPGVDDSLVTKNTGNGRNEEKADRKDVAKLFQGSSPTKVRTRTTCVDDRVLVRRPPVLGLVALRSCLNLLRYHVEAPGGAHDIGRVKGARDIAPPTASPFGHRCTVCVLLGPTGVMTHPSRMMSHQSANSVRATVPLCC